MSRNNNNNNNNNKSKRLEIIKGKPKRSKPNHNFISKECPIRKADFKNAYKEEVEIGKQRIMATVENLINPDAPVQPSPSIVPTVCGKLETLQEFTVPANQSAQIVLQPSLGVFGVARITGSDSVVSEEGISYNQYSTAPGHNSYTDGHIQKPKSDSKSHCRLVPGSSCDGFQFTLTTESHVFKSNKSDEAGGFYDMVFSGTFAITKFAGHFNRAITTDEFHFIIQRYVNGAWQDMYSYRATEDDQEFDLGSKTSPPLTYTGERIRIISTCSSTPADIYLTDLTVHAVAVNVAVSESLVVFKHSDANQAAIKSMSPTPGNPEIVESGAACLFSCVDFDLTQRGVCWGGVVSGEVDPVEVDRDMILSLPSHIRVTNAEGMFAAFQPKSMAYLADVEHSFLKSDVEHGGAFNPLIIYIEQSEVARTYEIIFTVKYHIRTPLNLYGPQTTPLEEGELLMLQRFITEYEWLTCNSDHIETIKKWLDGINYILNNSQDTVKGIGALARLAKNEVISMI